LTKATDQRSNKGADHESKVTESLMKTSKDGFDFLKDDDEIAEWEDNQEEMDRAWYDAEEEGNIRYGGGEDYNQFEDLENQDEKELAL